LDGSLLVGGEVDVDEELELLLDEEDELELLEDDEEEELELLELDEVDGDELLEELGGCELDEDGGCELLLDAGGLEDEEEEGMTEEVCVVDGENPGKAASIHGGGEGGASAAGPRPRSRTVRAAW